MKRLIQRYRYSVILLNQLVKTDFKLRYQGSVLGYVWSLLKPLALFIILYLVFTKFIRIGTDVPHYAVYLLLGIVIWNYFVEVTTGSVDAVVGKGDLIRKINFPKYVIVLAGSFSALINLGINLLVVGVFMLISGIDLRPFVILLPLLIFQLFVFSLAIAFFLSAAFVRFRDISHIWEVLIQGAFYATPIIYPLLLVPTGIAKLIILNPMAQIIQDSRYVAVIQSQPTISSLYGGNHLMRLVPVALTVGIAIIAGWYFRKRSKYFAEEV